MAADFSAHFDEVHAITCKAVRQVPEAQRDFRPVGEMMTAFDLIFHMFSQERVMLVGCVTGELAMSEFQAVQKDKENLQTIEDLARYGEAVHCETSQWLFSAPAAELVKPVETFFGPSTPEKLLLNALEHIFHHRGQLYVYLRMLGIEPVFVWTGEPIAVLRERARKRT